MYPTRPTLLALTLGSALSLLGASAPAISQGVRPAPKSYPNFAQEELTTEYDASPDWPSRPAHIGEFKDVTGLTIDAGGDIWIFNRGTDPVQVYKPDGTFVRSWGKGQFNSPHHIRIDPQGFVWTTDFRAHVVRKHTRDGGVLLTLGKWNEPGEDETHLNGPTDIAVLKDGTIFVTDGYFNRRIVHFSPEGKFVRSWGGYGTRPNQFVLPHAIAVDSRERLYVADRNSGRIQVFDRNGKSLDVWSGVMMPWGLSFSKRGGEERLWVCGSSPHWWVRNGKAPEFKDQLFVRFDTKGRVHQTWAVPLGAANKTALGECRGAHCIAEDASGNLYVGDVYGIRVQKFTPVTRR